MSENPHHKLIYDLVDGQLSSAETQRAEQLIAEAPQLKELYETLRDQQSALRSMPQYSLDDSFADQVVRAAQVEGLFDSKQDVEKTIIGSGFANWRGAAAAIAALAALILVSLFVVPGIQSGESGLAINSSSDSDSLEPNNSDREEKAVAASPKYADSEVADEAVGELEESEGMLKPNRDKSKHHDFAAPAPSFDNAAPSLDGVKSELAKLDSSPRVFATPDLDMAPGAAVSRGAPGGEMRSRAMAMPQEGLAQEGISQEERIEEFKHEGLGAAQQFAQTLREQPGQILFVSLDRDPKSLEQLQKAFQSNGVEVQWSQLVLDSDSNDDDMEPGRQEDLEEDLGPSEIAFNLRTTPAKMGAAMLQIGELADVLGVDPLVANFADSALFEPDANPSSATANASDAMERQLAETSRLNTFRLRKKEAERRLAKSPSESGVDVDRLGGGGGGGFGDAMEAMPGGRANEKNSDGAGLAADPSVRSDSKVVDGHAIREINQFFKLMPQKELSANDDPNGKLEQIRNYTLVIRFQNPPRQLTESAEGDSGVSSSPAGASALEQPAGNK